MSLETEPPLERAKGKGPTESSWREKGVGNPIGEGQPKVDEEEYAEHNEEEEGAEDDDMVDGDEEKHEEEVEVQIDDGDASKFIYPEHEDFSRGPLDNSVFSLFEVILSDMSMTIRGQISYNFNFLLLFDYLCNSNLFNCIFFTTAIHGKKSLEVPYSR
jgi:hypothetical protein